MVHKRSFGSECKKNDEPGYNATTVHNIIQTKNSDNDNNGLIGNTKKV